MFNVLYTICKFYNCWVPLVKFGLLHLGPVVFAVRMAVHSDFGDTWTNLVFFFIIVLMTHLRLLQVNTSLEFLLFPLSKSYAFFFNFILFQAGIKSHHPISENCFETPFGSNIE